ncbi:hypothetical protein HALLA_16800 [Halostagnicola larsenii XH-48]|uniref:UPF0215 protein HALLA_16800 n=1 Tax=Halostagnicola larsenii XH-48 TaxID=797299 RepID=W0JSM1_9EURY|nr:DUF99 family protein [Halostagnicola larsenii]AHG00210.1 hypothetical protein HALLA_16800 [Halostagnicola larsenii XH-48]
MKAGARALGIAESAAGEQSTLAGAVVRADRVVDGLAFSTCTVGGMDATDAIVSLVDDIDRPDVEVLLLGAVAPAWYNIVDLSRIARTTDQSVIAVTFEASAGLEDGLSDAFSGDQLEQRLERYRSLPPRRPVSINGETVYVRTAGIERSRAETVVREFTPEGGRPEPIRVARAAARAGRDYRFSDA